MSSVVNLSMGKEPVKERQFVNLDANPYVPDEFEVIEHVRRGVFYWDQTKVDLYVSPNQQNGKAITGLALGRELERRPVFNACLLDYLMRETGLIPDIWKGKRIHFWGTIYNHPDGGRCVRYLHWCGDLWGWSVRWLRDEWSDLDPTAVFARLV
jgi:hypothetical protein